MGGPEVVVRLSRRAQHDFDRALEYYLSQGPDLARRLISAIDEKIEEIREAPTRWPIWRAPNLRRILVTTFPYVLIYRLDAPDDVSIVALLHQHQDPSRRFPSR